jgi:hypothetical protein
VPDSKNMSPCTSYYFQLLPPLPMTLSMLLLLLQTWSTLMLPANFLLRR